MKSYLLVLLIISTSVFAQAEQAGCRKDYVIRSGDTLSGIAFTHVSKSVWTRGGSLEQVSKCNPQVGDVDLIYPGKSLVLPIGTDDEALADISEDISTDEISNEVEDIDVKSKPIVEEKRSHFIYGEFNSFHSELAATQTSGPGSGSEADELLSNPNFSGKIIYSINLSRDFSLRAILDFKNYIFSKDLDSQIGKDQDHLAINPGIGATYHAFSFLDLNLNLYSFEQSFYGADSSGSLVFEFERVMRFEINPELTILNQESFDLGLGAFGTYHLDGDKVSSSFGFGVEPFVKAFFDKKMRFHLRYYDLTYDFISSETRNEILEIGMGYQWEI